MSITGHGIDGCPGRVIFRNTQKICSSPLSFGSILRSGRSFGVGHGNSLQYSCLENSMDRGAWRATVQGVTKRQTQLNDWAHTHTTVFASVLKLMPRNLILFLRVKALKVSNGTRMESQVIIHWSLSTWCKLVYKTRTSLVVQGLRIFLPMQGPWIWLLVGDNSPGGGVTGPGATESPLWSPTCNRRRHRNEKPVRCGESSRYSPRPERVCSREGP